MFVQSIEEPDFFQAPQEATEDFSPKYYVESQLVIAVSHQVGWLPAVDGRIPAEYFYNLLREQGFSEVLSFDNETSADPIRVSSGSELDSAELTLFPVKWSTGQSVTDLLDQFYIHMEQAEAPNLTVDGQDATLIGAIPNWYLGAESHTGIGTHGPARPPRPLVNTATLRQLKLPVPDATSAQPGRVDVFVLDSVPTAESIEQAWMDWIALNPFYLFSNIVAKIPFVDPFSTSGKPFPAGYQPVGYQTEQALYLYASASAFSDIHPNAEKGREQSRDHGLFIAGILQLLTRDANLYVLEVLNEYGVGTFLSLAAGFEAVAALRTAERHAIVNCSFVLAFPDDNHDDSGWERMPSQSEEEILDGDDSGRLTDEQETQLQHDTRILRTAIELTSQTLHGIAGAAEAVIVAAVGNDSTQGDRKPTRYIARMSETPSFSDKIVAVGALNNTASSVEATYSNITPDNGLLVFGGEYDASGVGQAIVSLYLKELNGQAAETRGVARWMGTSFATPIAAAQIANTCRDQNIDPVDALRQLRLSGAMSKPAVIELT